jgi:hypothetical protein
MEEDGGGRGEDWNLYARRCSAERRKRREREAGRQRVRERDRRWHDSGAPVKLSKENKEDPEEARHADALIGATRRGLDDAGCPIGSRLFRRPQPPQDSPLSSLPGDKSLHDMRHWLLFFVLLTLHMTCEPVNEAGCRVFPTRILLSIEKRAPMTGSKRRHVLEQSFFWFGRRLEEDETGLPWSFVWRCPEDGLRCLQRQRFSSQPGSISSNSSL